MNNKDKTYAKVMLALAIGFSLAAEVANYTVNEYRPYTGNQTEKKAQEGESTSRYQNKLSVWK